MKKHDIARGLAMKPGGAGTAVDLANMDLYQHDKIQHAFV